MDGKDSGTSTPTTVVGGWTSRVASADREEGHERVREGGTTKGLNGGFVGGRKSRGAERVSAKAPDGFLPQVRKHNVSLPSCVTLYLLVHKRDYD